MTRNSSVESGEVEEDGMSDVEMHASQLEDNPEGENPSLDDEEEEEEDLSQGFGPARVFSNLPASRMAAEAVSEGRVITPRAVRVSPDARMELAMSSSSENTPLVPVSHLHKASETASIENSVDTLEGLELVSTAWRFARQRTKSAVELAKLAQADPNLLNVAIPVYKLCRNIPQARRSSYHMRTPLATGYVDPKRRY